MAGFDTNEILGTLMTGIAKVAETVQIIREPIETNGKMIIPAIVAKVALGAGGGSGKRMGGGGEEGMGNGGGGGMTLTPVFLVIDEKGERLVTVPDALSAASGQVIHKIKEMAESFFSGKSQQKEEKT
ncbi:MAG: hypothetical protein HY200_04120 [Nitrospirae bacterium]|nr:hypothetical protein [Nitrospirota bacterium]MBI3594120.1 hypothetical protein [Nitrospirota bacterium]